MDFLVRRSFLPPAADWNPGVVTKTYLLGFLSPVPVACLVDKPACLVEKLQEPDY